MPIRIGLLAIWAVGSVEPKALRHELAFRCV
jgi:hypothetical protein